jgi:putative PIN family toxin of toxin-antitoxin system
MRVVIDTNVMVSGDLSPHGPLGRIVNALLSGAITVLYADRILSEYREVLLRPTFGFPRSDVEVLLDFLESRENMSSHGRFRYCRPERFTVSGSRNQRQCRRPNPKFQIFWNFGLITGNIKHFKFKPRRGQHSVLIMCSGYNARRFRSRL